MNLVMRRLTHFRKSVQDSYFLQVKSVSTDGVVGRLSARNIPLDVNLCATNPDLVLSHLQARCDESNLKVKVYKLGELRTSRNSEIVLSNEAKRKKHLLSNQIGRLMAERNRVSPDTGTKKADASTGAMEVQEEDGRCGELKVASMKVEVEGLNAFIQESDKKIDVLNEEIKLNFMMLPNLLHDSVPDGKDEEDNIIVSEWGTHARKVGEHFLWHDDIALSLRGLDLPAAVRMSGSRFAVLTGQVARLERALTNYFLDFFTGLGGDTDGDGDSGGGDNHRRYEEVSVPLIVTRSTLESTGQLPKFEDDLFRITHNLHDEDAFLIPTAEVPLTCLQKGQLLANPDTQLPFKHVCSSPCFRAEAGSRGRDTRGLLRQHQFQKIELVKVCSPATADREYADMLQDVERLLISLDLPFRKVLLNSSDMGFSSSLCHDFEVWLPGQQQYREISSVSHCADFQTRRMGLRYRVVDPAEEEKDKKKEKKKSANPKKVTVFPHTMNGSGVAVGRALVAILENFQRPDGSVDIPPVLYPYMNGVTSLVPPPPPSSSSSAPR